MTTISYSIINYKKYKILLIKNYNPTINSVFRNLHPLSKKFLLSQFINSPFDPVTVPENVYKKGFGFSYLNLTVLLKSCKIYLFSNFYFFKIFLVITY